MTLHADMILARFLRLPRVSFAGEFYRQLTRERQCLKALKMGCPFFNSHLSAQVS
jgi:hypothetical protein